MFSSNLATPNQRVVGGLKMGGGLLLPSGELAARQTEAPPPPSSASEPPSSLLHHLEPGPDALFDLATGEGTRVRNALACDVSEGGRPTMVFFAAPPRGSVLKCRRFDNVDEDDEDERVLVLQAFPELESITVISCNAHLVVAATASYVACFVRDDAVSLRRVFFGSARSLHTPNMAAPHDCGLVDASVCPVRFGRRSRCEVLLMLRCGELLALTPDVRRLPTEHRLTSLGGLGGASRVTGALRYLLHGRSLVVLWGADVWVVDATLGAVHAPVARVRNVFQCARPAVFLRARVPVPVSVEEVAVAPGLAASGLVAVALTDEVLLLDARWGRVLLSRMVPFVDPVRCLCFAPDATSVFSLSARGRLGQHRVRFLGDDAVQWDGDAVYADTVLVGLNVPALAPTGLTIDALGRILVATTLGHVVQQTMDSAANAPAWLVAELMARCHGDARAQPKPEAWTSVLDEGVERAARAESAELERSLFALDAPLVGDVRLLSELDAEWKD